ncbi:hypothetical protein CTEN210_06225 [Chaetoceros tenuissimus]|uniref:Thiol-disulfide oxidoreductase DCC n=1 Tax=Chaetoceros tenuissimus TaxID=426638 RepID=A0AAD3CQ34_9STRA|nr:hypothetical protein CTEN210_06225 [Chaetoceros tenuissimus]
MNALQRRNIIFQTLKHLNSIGARNLQTSQMTTRLPLTTRLLHNSMLKNDNNRVEFPAVGNQSLFHPQQYRCFSTAGSTVAKEDASSEISTKLAEKAFEEDDRPIILFDGVCNFCNSSVNFIIDHDEHAKFRFTFIQGPLGKSLLMKHGKDVNDLSSMVLVTKEGNAYFKSDAVLKISNDLDGYMYPMLANIGAWVPSFLRDHAYTLIAENRYRFLGKKDECRLDHVSKLRERFVE